MRYTNTLRLPKAFERAVAADTYSQGAADISVTSLIGPAQLRTLRRRHEDHLVEDVSERVWSLLGKLCHGLLEQAAGWEAPGAALAKIHELIFDSSKSAEERVTSVREVLLAHRADTADIIERRLYADHSGYRISGQVDMLLEDEGIWGIGDWKLTSVWTWIYGGRHEWEQQLNVYRWLAKLNGYDAKWLRIYAIFRDWRETETTTNTDYPPRPIMVMEIPMWSDAEVDLFVGRRVEQHKLAEGLEDHELPWCTAAERWAKPESWAVVKEGAKAARRVLPLLAAAMDYMEENNLDPEVYKIQHRPGESVRCNKYCPARAFCHQRAEATKISVHTVEGVRNAASSREPGSGDRATEQGRAHWSVVRGS